VLVAIRAVPWNPGRAALNASRAGQKRTKPDGPPEADPLPAIALPHPIRSRCTAPTTLIVAFFPARLGIERGTTWISRARARIATEAQGRWLLAG